MKNFTAIIERGRGDWYVALCPEPDHDVILIGKLMSIIRQSGLVRIDFIR